MKTKLKSIIAYHMAVGHRVAAAMVCALCAVGLAAFAEESVTINEVKSLQPWDKAKGTITVDYSLGGLDAAKEYKVAFDITANGVTKGVTNAATKLTSGKQAVFTNDTVSLFSAETRAEDAKVKVSLIAIKAKPLPVAPEGFVDLGVKDANGKPLYWAEKNLGASKPEDYGDYFAWGETAPYYTTTGGWPATPTWKSGKESGYAWQSYCGSSSFSEWSTPPYDATTKILKPEFDAATAVNSSWRTQTSEEIIALAANCVWIWCDGNKEKYNNTTVKGYIVYKAKNDADKGKANMNGTWKKWDVSQSKYVTDGASEATGYTTSDPHIFFPAAGYSDGASRSSAGSVCRYWSSSRTSDSPNSAYYLYCNSSNVFPQFSNYRNCGASVRPVTN